MRKILIKLLLYFIIIFVLDQAIKYIFVNGFRFKSDFIDLILVYNKGVAFSMFAFLGEYLKFIQVALLCIIVVYLLKDREFLQRFYSEFGIILGAGSSNIFDRFIHGGVVDYVFWHKWFNFAVFNFADVMIDLAVACILLRLLLKK